jgi:Xaa-Pro aminopeptidase
MANRRGFLKGSLAGGAMVAVSGGRFAGAAPRAVTPRGTPAEVPPATYRTRVAAVQAELGKRELGALVITSQDAYDTRYLSGHAPGVLVVPTAGDPVLFAPGRPRTWLSDVRAERELGAMFDKAAEQLKAAGAASAGIALAGEYGWAARARLGAALPQARFVEGNEIQDRLRLIKDEYEIAFMRRAQDVSDAQIVAGQAAIRPGRTDREALADMVQAAVVLGMDLDTSRHLIGYGPGTDDLWAPLTDRRIKTGEVLNFEGIVYYGHYVIETPVTFAVGKVSARQRDLAAINFEALQAGLAAVKPGAPLASVVDATNAVLKRGGFDKMIRRHGHFSGLDNNDRPAFDEGIKAGLTLQPGMTVSYHTTITVPDKEAIVIAGRELLVTTKGYEIFSRIPLTAMVEVG